MEINGKTISLTIPANLIQVLRTYNHQNEDTSASLKRKTSIFTIEESIYEICKITRKYFHGLEKPEAILQVPFSKIERR